MASPTTTQPLTQDHRKAAMRLRGLERIASTLKAQRGLISVHDYQKLHAELAVKLDDARRAVERHVERAEAIEQAEAAPVDTGQVSLYGKIHQAHPSRTVRNGGGHRVSTPLCGQRSSRFYPSPVTVPGHEVDCEKCLNALAG